MCMACKMYEVCGWRIVYSEYSSHTHNNMSGNREERKNLIKIRYF